MGEKIGTKEQEPASKAEIEKQLEAEKPAVVQPRFRDVAREIGIDFTFFRDQVPGRFFLPEIMGGGAGWLDFDRDGELDIYLTTGCELRPEGKPETEHSNQLFRQLEGKFENVSEPALAASGTAGHTGYGQGCAVGDFDADGFPDLYVTNYGKNALFRNNGDGTFTEVTDSADVGSDIWGTSTMWLDINDDGLLDLYAANFLNVTFDNIKSCDYGSEPGYCGPGSYDGTPDRVYLNNGDGTFRDGREELGIDKVGKGLALAALDFDGDLKPDLYIANDMMSNFLYTRSSPLRTDSGQKLFGEVATSAGCAVAESGNNEASMGIAAEDFNGDGLFDVFLTHFYRAKNTLYSNLGDLLFRDASRKSRIAATSFHTLGFGTIAIDYDQDSYLDIFVTNGNVLGDAYQPSEMPPQLLRNRGNGRFDDITDQAGPYFEAAWLGRGAAGADFDNDGDLDLVVSHLNEPVSLLRNETETNNHFIGVELHTLNRVPPVGGRVVVKLGERELVRPIATGGSYLSSSDTRILFGLGEVTEPVKVEVHWPSGQVDTHAGLQVDRYWQLIEGQEVQPDATR